MEKVKVVSLFSGIGGFEEGIKMSSIPYEIVFASEINEFAKKSYSANFNDANLFGDITKISEKDIPNHDLLLAGFPCQSFSIAGRREGFYDTRGTLFFDVARILKEKKPKYIILENVKNLVSHDRYRTIKVILNVLSDIGYTIDFSVVNSSEAGVPQNRDRTYIVGIYNYPSVKFEDDKRNATVTKLKRELNNQEFNSFNFFNELYYQNDVKYIEDILDEDVPCNYYFESNKIYEFLKVNDFKDAINNEKKIIKLFDLPRTVHNDLERQRRVYSTKGISPTVLARSDSTKICVFQGNSIKIRKLTPEENFYIQGFGKEFVKNIKNKKMSATQMYKQSGNAVSPPVITEIFKLLYSWEEKANDKK